MMRVQRATMRDARGDIPLSQRAAKVAEADEADEAAEAAESAESDESDDAAEAAEADEAAEAAERGDGALAWRFEVISARDRGDVAPGEPCFEQVDAVRRLRAVRARRRARGAGALPETTR